MDLADPAVAAPAQTLGRWVSRAAGFKRDAAEVRGPRSRIEDIVARARTNAESLAAGTK